MDNWLKKNNWLTKNSWRKYMAVFRISWQNSLVYRLNFLMWRLRSIVLFLAVYFFWLAVYRFARQLADYQGETMLTYIIGASLLGSLVLSSRSIDVSAEIGTGSLSNYLLKPINYFYYWLARDWADKVLNLIFIFLELSLFFIIFRPPFFWQTNIFYLFSFLVFSFLGVFIYFYLSLIVSLSTFWYPEDNGWPARFLFNVLIPFFSGGFFPLDILPSPFFVFLRVLPSAYFIFFPLKIYLGKLGLGAILAGFLVSLFWIFSLTLLARLLWRKGLKNYTATGL